MEFAADPQPTPQTFVVNGVVIDLRTETLLQPGGDRVALRPQAFAMLRYLIANPNRIVMKNELVQEIWHGAAVTDDSLVQCVREIRRALGDHRRAFLQTASRRGYCLVLAQEPQAAVSSTPSIAVLPFRRLDGPGVEFAEGLAEDLAAGLSKIRGLLVVARPMLTTSEPRDLAVKLGVRYLVSGSIRRSANRLRIAAEIVDGTSGAYVWAGRFDGTADEVFDLQDRLVDQIVGVVEASIRRAEVERARRKRSESLDAYDLCLQAIPHVLANTRQDGKKALELLKAALDVDPAYLPAHAYAAWCHEQRYLRNGFDPADRAAALDHADLAVGANSDDPQVLGIAAFVRANLTREYDAALEVLDRALAINGNSPLTLGFSALVSAHGEHISRALDHANKALRLTPPDDPLNYHPYCALTVANLFAGNFAEAARYAGITVRANPGFTVPHAYLVTSLVQLGESEAALRAARRLLEVDPSFTVAGFERMNNVRETMMDMIANALRRADLS